MLYRIALKTYNGTLYYLTTDEESPKTDAEINFDSIQFLSKLNATHAHTFSSEELAKKCCENLPYPYNEKVTLILTHSKESLPAIRIYYRIAKIQFGKINYIDHNKKFTQNIIPQTASFANLNNAEEFFNSLAKFTQKTSCITEVHDFGPPKFLFKDYFINSNGKKTEEFPLA